MRAIAQTPYDKNNDNDDDNIIIIINLFAKYNNTANIMNSGGRTTRQLNALTVAIEKHK